MLILDHAHQRFETNVKNAQPVYKWEEMLGEICAPTEDTLIH